MKYDIPAPTFTYYLSPDEDGVWQATSVPRRGAFKKNQVWQQ
jgi:hypothetical protein